MFIDQVRHSGQFRTRVRLRKVAASTGGFGGIVTPSTGEFTVFARVQYPSGGEMLRGGGVEGRVDAVFEWRYRQDVSANQTWQVRHGTDSYDVSRMIHLPDPDHPVTTRADCTLVATT